MGAFKEIYDENIYLPEEPSDQMEFKGLLELFAGFRVYSASVEVDVEAENIAEIATPLKPLPNEVFIRL